MGSNAFDIRWLKSTFHDYPSIFSLKVIITGTASRELDPKVPSVSPCVKGANVPKSSVLRNQMPRGQAAGNTLFLYYCLTFNIILL